jgi:hypothetical protein
MRYHPNKKDDVTPRCVVTMNPPKDWAKDFVTAVTTTRVIVNPPLFIFGPFEFWICLRDVPD